MEIFMWITGSVLLYTIIGAVVYIYYPPHDTYENGEETDAAVSGCIWPIMFIFIGIEYVIDVLKWPFKQLSKIRNARIARLNNKNAANNTKRIPYGTPPIKNDR